VRRIGLPRESRQTLNRCLQSTNLRVLPCAQSHRQTSFARLADDLAVVPRTPVVAAILRTDVSGMLARVVDYRRRGRGSITPTGGYTCGDAALSPVRRNLREDAYERCRREFDHRDPRTHRQSRQSAGRGLYPAPQQPERCSGATPTCACIAVRAFRKACCRAITSRLSAARPGHLGQTSCRPPPLQQRESVALAEQAGMQLLAVPFTPTTPNTFSSRAGACSPTRWNT